MRFGPLPLDQAEGAVLAHACRTATGRIAKGTRLDAAALDALAGAGMTEVIVARLDPGDLREDAAAEAVAQACAHPSLRARAVGTGRVNLHAHDAGVFLCAAARVGALNAVDPAITLATLPPFARVAAGEMVATVKIIPFAVPQAQVSRAAACAQDGDAALMQVAGFRPLRCALLQTDLPVLKPSVADKTVALTRARIAALGGSLHDAGRVAHDAGALARAIRAVDGAKVLIVFGASAMCDPDDVIPAAIRAAGGQVERVGMPVDPGNLLVLGRVGALQVVGAPGCARSPKENGFDWVLARLFAGLELRGADIAAMGVGGLLTEIPTRPRPRAAR